MKRQFVTFNIEEFPSKIGQPSNRINVEQQDNQISKNFKQNNNQPNKLNPPRFEQHSLTGLETSLTVSVSKDQMLLMNSKSSHQLGQKKQQNKQTLRVDQMNSLYNTSQFDQMSMNISISKTNQNMTQQNLSYISENKEGKTLRRPQELKPYQATYNDSEMNIVINEMKSATKPQNQYQQTELERRKRENKVALFVKNQGLLDNLKCSNAESEHSQNFQENSSFHQAYFKLPESNINEEKNNLRESKVLLKIEAKRSNAIEKIQPNLNRFVQNKQALKSPPNSKKLTLRDYMHLTQLASRGKDIEPPSAATLGSPRVSKMSDQNSPRSVGSSRRKKGHISNFEVMQRIKGEICKDIQLMRDNLSVLLKYFSEQGGLYEPQQSQIMSVYTVGRIIKDKMLTGNDQIVRFLKGENLSLAKNL